MVKIKKIAGVFITGAMILTSIGAVSKAIDTVKIVEAYTQSDITAVNNKISHLENSIKNNYLGLKNQAQWEIYIKEARSLNSKLPNGSTKNSYAGRINKAEDVVKAAARVNQLEFSMAKNAHTLKNLPQWNIYFDLAVTDMLKMDRSQYAAQYDELSERLLDKAVELDALESGNPIK